MSAQRPPSRSAPASPLPADVRTAGKDAKRPTRPRSASSACSLEQLTKSMSKDMAGGDGGDDAATATASGASAATSAYNDMLPDTLADAVTSAGGLGLAHDL